MQDTRNQSAHPAAPPALLFIFGAHGDLVQRLLVPSLYRLCRDGLLDDATEVYGIDHNEATDEAFRERLSGFLHDLTRHPEAEGGGEKVVPACWRSLRERLHYLKGDFTDPDAYQDIARELAQRPGANAVFYLATSPGFFATIVQQLADAGLCDEGRGGFRRVAIEKPFGTDLASAQQLNALLYRHLHERQIYRVDHFAAKDATRNIGVQRFANGIVDAFWNHRHIEHVQISALETLGVGSRGRFYDRTGALRDMVPNHLFQLLAQVAMEPPATPDEAGWRKAKTDAIRAIEVQADDLALRNSVCGQYTAGNGQPGYLEAGNVPPDSTTETYIAVRLTLDAPRWTGVPFYLRTGKCLSRRSTEIVVQFRAPEHGLPNQSAGPTRLVLTLDPQESIAMEWSVRPPGPIVELGRTTLQHNPADLFPDKASTGYETLLYHCLTGVQTLFPTAQEAEAAWTAIGPFQRAWCERKPCGYRAGEDGPAEADDLIQRDGFDWWRPSS
ncbi:glucose-6-phosphate dehydrogenase [Verticiella sediminum]|uniref:glucose-6-phosphate dehydrogenase n=1 Tax=Verticiella sediminum TaxID=1247510 RepID=UPI001FE9B538|nr:glucose-6-phosphate dehydrogenase [Verticiella sediminum]